MLFILIFLWPVTLPLLAGYGYILYLLARKHRFAACITLALLPFMAYYSMQCYWYSQAIPAKIELAYPVSLYEEGGFREGCGTVVFKITDHTQKSLQREGISFLGNATEARGHAGDAYYHYAAWQPTPAPASWSNDGGWLLCHGLDDETQRKISLALQSPGAYYTEKQEGTLLVIPSLGYVVFSFFG